MFDIELLVNKHLKPLALTNSDFRKKASELRHTGQFLRLLNEGFDIFSVAESPDFIISDGSIHVGLEHEILVETTSKEIEGAIDNLFDHAQNEFRRVHPDLKYLFNIFLHEKFIAPPKSKNSEYAQVINALVHFYLQMGHLEQNTIIAQIGCMPHTELDFEPNLGAWMQKTLTPDIFNNALNKKDRKIENYRLKSGIEEQWLLVVIRSLGESSYEMGENLVGLDFNTRFTRVYILEAFTWKLHQIK